MLHIGYRAGVIEDDDPARVVGAHWDVMTVLVLHPNRTMKVQLSQQD